MTDSTATDRLTLAPKITLESVSRPYKSVPSGCASVGPCKRSAGLKVVGLCPAIKGANTAASATITTSTNPVTALGERTKDFHNDGLLLALSVAAASSVA